MWSTIFYVAGWILTRLSLWSINCKIYLCNICGTEIPYLFCSLRLVSIPKGSQSVPKGSQVGLTLILERVRRFEKVRAKIWKKDVRKLYWNKLSRGENFAIQQNFCILQRAPFCFVNDGGWVDKLLESVKYLPCVQFPPPPTPTPTCPSHSTLALTGSLGDFTTHTANCQLPTHSWNFPLIYAQMSLRPLAGQLSPTQT